jgi:translation elongation factor EF-Tu-like GTPase
MDTEEQPDFIATVSYLSAEQGGLKVPATSGYRPQIKFEFIEKQTAAEQVFVDDDMVFPGDTVKAKIRLLAPEFFTNALTEGTSFDFSQGEKIIGTGIINQIINIELKRQG